MMIGMEMRNDPRTAIGIGGMIGIGTSRIDAGTPIPIAPDRPMEG